MKEESIDDLFDKLCDLLNDQYNGDATSADVAAFVMKIEEKNPNFKYKAESLLEFRDKVRHGNILPKHEQTIGGALKHIGALTFFGFGMYLMYLIFLVLSGYK